MSLSEFELIERYFCRGLRIRDDVVLGIGDDAGVVRVRAGHELVSAIATLSAASPGVNIRRPREFGHRCLATALNRLAASGAEPHWTTLALTLPRAEEPWLKAFSRGLRDLAEREEIQLIGGDTTRGPLAVTVVVDGTVPSGKAVRCDGARPGDLVFVTGPMGSARDARGRTLVESRPQATAGKRTSGSRADLPVPRVRCAMALRGRASAACDLSPGLSTAVEAMLSASAVGATLYPDRLPSTAPLDHPGISRSQRLGLSAGGDLELCFTLPRDERGGIEALVAGLGVIATEIGEVEATPGLRLRLD